MLSETTKRNVDADYVTTRFDHRDDRKHRSSREPEVLDHKITIERAA